MTLFLRLYFLLVALLLGLCLPGLAQRTDALTSSPYQLKPGKEATLLSVGGITSGVGTYLYRNTENIMLSEIQLDGINGFDRIAADFSSDAAARASDVLFIGSAVAPFALLADKDIRRYATQIGFMYGEVFLLTTGLTTLIKSTAQRPRPYVYEEGLPGTTVLSANDRAAFLSGHTSASAAGCFFAAQVYAGFHPDSPQRWIVWGAAATVPAVTGFLRVRAGQHYPTDVIAGYALGALVGSGVPILHRRVKSVLPEGGSLTTTGKAVYASYTF